ncbi:MAG: phosphatidate cytidylyltransferase [Gemmatimonadales bacterium]|jgi:phosphatidate cytidylyltransferase
MSSDLPRRVMVAAIGIPVAVGMVFLGHWWLTALLVVFGLVGTAELYRLAQTAGVRPLAAAGMAGAAALPIVTYGIVQGVWVPDLRWLAFGVAAWLVLVTGQAVALRGPTARPLEAAAVTVFGAVYAGGLPAFLILLRHSPGPPSEWAATAVVFLPLLVIWVGDSVAMGVGYAVRGPKLAPVLSPNKTWAGAIGGGLAAVVAAPLYGALVLRPLGIDLSLWQLAVLGLVLSLLGQSGDVAESLFKRQVGVKDSGGFFPGHGGVLDRFDALYWAIPGATVLLTIFGVL